MSAYQWSAFASLCMLCFGLSAMWQLSNNDGEIQRWARAEAERTQPPVCDRPSCYDGPDTVASRLEHGCVPDWKRP
jgi:hypothetical protein